MKKNFHITSIYAIAALLIGISSLSCIISPFYSEYITGGAMIFIIGAYLLNKKFHTERVPTALIPLLCLFFYFLISCLLKVDSYVNVYSSLCKWGFFFAIFLFVSRLNEIIRVFWGMMFIVGVFQSVMVFFQFFNIVPSFNPFFPVSGFYSNPASAAMCISVSIVIAICEVINCRMKLSLQMILKLFLVFFLGVAVLLCDSRTAVISILVAVGYLIFANFTKTKKNRFAAIFAVAFIFVVLLGALYCLRPESADSRLLVWKISLLDWHNSVFCGKGPCSFARCYQYAQANYFMVERSVGETLLADEFYHPFNEPIHILYELGLIGLLAFVFIFFSLNHRIDRRAMAVLICIASASLFLYVADITYLVFCLAIVLAICTKTIACFNNGRRFMSIIIIFFGMLSLTSMVLLEPYKETVNYLAQIDHQDITEENFQEYEEFVKAHPTYDRFCALGDYYCVTGDTRSAEDNYQLAYHMIPCRIRALFSLFQLYEKNDDEKAMFYAKMVLYGRFKQEGTYVLARKEEARSYLSGVPEYFPLME